MITSEEQYDRIRIDDAISKWTIMDLGIVLLDSDYEVLIKDVTEAMQTGQDLKEALGQSYKSVEGVVPEDDYFVEVIKELKEIQEENAMSISRDIIRQQVMSQVIDKAVSKALPHMPALTHVKTSPFESTFQSCPPGEFIKQYLQPALRAVFEDSSLQEAIFTFFDRTRLIEAARKEVVSFGLSTVPEDIATRFVDVDGHSRFITEQDFQEYREGLFAILEPSFVGDLSKQEIKSLRTDLKQGLAFFTQALNRKADFRAGWNAAGEQVTAGITASLNNKSLPRSLSVDEAWTQYKNAPLWPPETSIFTRKQIFEVDVYNLQKLIATHHGLEIFEFSDMRNDSTHQVSVKNEAVPNPGRNPLCQMVKGSMSINYLGFILQDLCHKGVVDEGEYLITVSW